jgi:hypothetical protein
MIIYKISEVILVVAINHKYSIIDSIIIFVNDDLSGPFNLTKKIIVNNPIICRANILSVINACKSHEKRGTIKFAHIIKYKLIIA